MSRLCLGLMGYDATRPVATLERVRPHKTRQRALLPLCVVCLLHVVTRPQHATCSTTCAGTLRKRNKEKRARAAFNAARAARFLNFPKEILHVDE
jgi:hypothetical protein